MHARLFAIDFAFLVLTFAVVYTALGSIARRYNATRHPKGSRHDH